MSRSRAPSFFLACVLAGSLAAQGSDNTTRTLSTEQIAFKLPAGWEWQSEIASNIALKKDIKVKDRTYTITAEMVYSAQGFMADTIAGIEKKVAASKGDLVDFKSKRGEKFAGTSATLVTYSRVRGEDRKEFEDERQYLFRRNGALYNWTERADRSIASQAGAAFAAARAAITFTTKDTAREPKRWEDAGLKYVVPADFELEKEGPLPTADKGTTLLHVGTTVTIKGDSFYVQCALGAQKSTNSLDDVEKQGKKIFDDNFDDIQDFKIVEKQTLKGEKALLMTFTGVPKMKEGHGGGQKPPRVRRQFWWVKRKGFIMNWEEVIPVEANPAVETALKKARDGITWL